MISKKKKNETRELLRAYVARFTSANKAARTIKGTSPSTISAILNGKYVNISDAMWNLIYSQVVNNHAYDWTIVQTNTFKDITFVLDDAKNNANCRWVVGIAGCGKTTAAEAYQRDHDNVFLVRCDADMAKSDFVAAIAAQCGIKTMGIRLRSMIEEIVQYISSVDSPLIIFDEADKLPEHIFYYFIDLYNQLEGLSGMIFFSTDYIKRRMSYGLQYSKKGYNEIFSRIGRKYYDVNECDTNDVISLCVANGISEKKAISEVLRDADHAEFGAGNSSSRNAATSYDLRCVKRAIKRLKVMMQVASTETEEEDKSCGQ